jgi:hypothetical protein
MQGFVSSKKTSAAPTTDANKDPESILRLSLPINEKNPIRTVQVGCVQRLKQIASSTCFARVHADGPCGFAYTSPCIHWQRSVAGSFGRSTKCSHSSHTRCALAFGSCWRRCASSFCIPTMLLWACVPPAGGIGDEDGQGFERDSAREVG